MTTPFMMESHTSASSGVIGRKRYSSQLGDEPAAVLRVVDYAANRESWPGIWRGTVAFSRFRYSELKAGRGSVPEERRARPVAFRLTLLRVGLGF